MNDISIPSAVELVAAEGQPKRFSMLAYTGGKLNLAGYQFPVVVDLATAKTARETTPILRDHDTSRIVGSGVVTIGSDGITVEGSISGTGPDAQEIIATSANQFPWEASIGARPGRLEKIESGRTVALNGRTFAGPILVSRDTTIREVSFVVMGADEEGATANVAAKGKRMADEIEIGNETVEETSPVTAERERILAIRRDISAIAHLNPQRAQQLELEAIGGDISRDILRDECLGILRASRPHAPQRHHSGSEAPARDVLAASLMIRAGNEPLAVQCFGERAAEVARRQRITNLPDLCAASLRTEGRDVPSGRDEMIKAAFSTLTLPNVLSNVMGKTIESAYEEAMSDTASFATIKSAVSFKSQRAIRPTSIETVSALAPDGEIVHSTLGEESTFTWNVDTFARMISITRHDVIDDDLGLFDQVPAMLGQAAVRKVLDLLYETIMGGETAGFFASGNGNLLEAGSALAVGSLGTAVTAFRSQRDSQGNDISLRPAALVVPPSLELTARALLHSAEVRDTSSDTLAPTGNPVAGIVPNLVVESRLGNTVKFASASAVAYFLFGPPSSSAIVLGYLEGKRSPTVEVEDSDFSKLGMQMRVYHDFGVALGDPKAALKATGAGS